MAAPHIGLPELDVRTLTEVCRRNDVSYLAVFGSSARGEDSPNSDVDLIVRISKRKSLLGLIALEREISNAIGREVDLHTEASISPYLQQSIAQDLQVIYEA